MTAYSFFSKDILAMSGGYMEQGNKYLEAVLYLQHLQNKSDREKYSKDKTKKGYDIPGGSSGIKRSAPKPPVKSFKTGRKAPSKPRTLKARPVK